MLKNKFIIVMPVWNAEKLIIPAIKSVLQQDFEDIGLIIRDDLSTDNTRKVICDYFKSPLSNMFLMSPEESKHTVLFVSNKEKLYAPGNIYESVVEYVENDEAIIGVVDGDDALIKNNVLSLIYDIYQKNNPLVVYTNYMNATGQKGHCAEIADTKTYRKSGWVSSHFRTAKAHLYKKINKEDLMYKGQYFKRAGDLALMYPLIEMAGNDRTIFYDDICYLYNNNLSTNDHNMGLNEQREFATIIQNMKPYEELK